jgi:hypothetical protein
MVEAFEVAQTRPEQERAPALEKGNPQKINLILFDIKLTQVYCTYNVKI